MKGFFFSLSLALISQTTIATLLDQIRGHECSIEAGVKEELRESYNCTIKKS